jgi:hypothetical protein
LAGTSWWNAASTGDDELDRNPSIWMMNDDYGEIWRLWNIMDVDGELPYPYLMYATGTSVPKRPYMSAGVADLILFIHI